LVEITLIKKLDRKVEKKKIYTIQLKKEKLFSHHPCVDLHRCLKSTK